MPKGFNLRLCYWKSWDMKLFCSSFLPLTRTDSPTSNQISLMKVFSGTKNCVTHGLDLLGIYNFACFITKCRHPIFSLSHLWHFVFTYNIQQLVVCFILDDLEKVCSTLKSVYKWMSLYKCPLYDHSWPFYCHMCEYLSQNWGSDGHFEMLNGSKSWLGQKLWPQM